MEWGLPHRGRISPEEAAVERCSPAAASLDRGERRARRAAMLEVVDVMLADRELDRRPSNCR